MTEIGESPRAEPGSVEPGAILGVEQVQIGGVKRDVNRVADRGRQVGVDLGHHAARAAVLEEQERGVAQRLDQANRRRDRARRRGFDDKDVFGAHAEHRFAPGEPGID